MSTSPSPFPVPKSSRLALLVAALAVLCIAAFQLLPELGLVDFHREEGRRVIPAREMIESGNWVVPTLWSLPYLSKPPGIFWALALVFECVGDSSEIVARSLSVGSTLLTALGLLWLARRKYGLRAGVYAAALFLLAVETQTKGRMAEIEAPLTLAVFVAVGAAWLAREGRTVWWTVAGLGLAAAVLLKGPVALLYFLSAPLLMALAQRRPSELLRPGLAWSLFIGLGLPAIWAWKLFGELGSETVLAQWNSQVTGQGGRSVAEFLQERGKYLGGSLFAFAPALWILLAGLRTSVARRWPADSRLAIPLWTVLGGWVFFLLFPGTSVRYLAPAFPFVALLAGEALARASSMPADVTFQQRLARLAQVLAGLAVLTSAALLVAYFVPLGDVRTNGLGLFLALLLATLGVFVWKVRDERRLPSAFLLIPLVLGQVLVTQAEPAKALRQARRVHAQAMDAAMPPGATLQLLSWSSFNTLAYLEHDVRIAASLSELEPGNWLLVEARHLSLVESAHPETRRALELVIRKRDWHLLQISPPGGR